VVQQQHEMDNALKAAADMSSANSRLVIIPKACSIEWRSPTFMGLPIRCEMIKAIWSSVLPRAARPMSCKIKRSLLTKPFASLVRKPISLAFNKLSWVIGVFGGSGEPAIRHFFPLGAHFGKILLECQLVAEDFHLTRNTLYFVSINCGRKFNAHLAHRGTRHSFDPFARPPATERLVWKWCSQNTMRAGYPRCIAESQVQGSSHC
jgi:hypothetical protein